MKYQINISGIHCDGCKNLITMNLEEQNFRNITVDRATNVATFEGGDPAEVEENLEKAFAEIPEYSYSNLTVIYS